MREEEIVSETHRVRREISAQFNNDVHAFFEYVRQRETLKSKAPDVLIPVDVALDLKPDHAKPLDDRSRK